MLLLDMHKVCPHVNSIAHYQQEYFTQCVHMVLQVNTTSPRVIAVTATCTLADVLLSDFQKPTYESQVLTLTRQICCFADVHVASLVSLTSDTDTTCETSWH